MKIPKKYKKQIKDNVSTSKSVEPEEVKEERYYCTRAFDHAQILDNGNISPCCPPWVNHYTLGNINDKNYEEIWNGEAAQNFRESILDGSFKYCSRKSCPHLQEKSYSVMKLSDLADKASREKGQWKEIYLDIKGKKTILSHSPYEVQFCNDRSCNLSCPSCRRELIMVKGKQKEKQIRTQEKFKNTFLKDVYNMVITGSGDAFASPVFRKLLMTLKEDDCPKLNSICLLTNGLLVKKHWNILSNYVLQNLTCISVSVDASNKEIYEINRRGGDWEQLKENLVFIKNKRQQITNFHDYAISFVVQQNNYNQILDFARMAIDYGCDRVSFQRIEPDFIRDLSEDWEEEWKEKAIQLTTHTEHENFLDILNSEEWSEICKDIKVEFGALADMKNR
jgi:radical SAM protein with 4Fe4S-binding SPASM domain